MDVFLSIARNVTLLLALAFVYTLFIPLLRRFPQFIQDCGTGVIFGMFAVLTMLDSTALFEGVFFDSRHVILMAAAMVGGVRGGSIALLISGIYRWYDGGIGLFPGIGSMVTALLIGVIYYRLTDGDIHLRWGHLVTGMLLAFVPMVWVLTLPDGIGLTLLPRIALPYFILYPATTFVLMWMISLSYQRLELTEALSRSERRQRAIFDQTPLAILFLKPDGTIENVNSSMAQLVEQEYWQLLGKHFRDVNWNWDENGQDTVEIVADMIQSARNGQFTRTSFELVRNDKALVMDTTCLPLTDEKGNVSLIIIEAHNITDELSSKQHQLALEFERERNQILQHLIADASHHLRTPLSIIGSSTYLIKRQMQMLEVIKDPIMEKVQGQFARMEEARIDLNEIVEDLLNLMRLDNSSQYKFVTLDMVQFVRDYVESYYGVASSNKQTFEAHFPDEPMLVNMVTEVLRRVVQNLVENGLRYTPEGGTITLTLESTATDAVLKVSDTGIGIPEDELPRIYDRFYRASNALAKSRKGTGLGLAITKKTVELHDGSIEIESEVGVGTTFIVKLPLVEPIALEAH